MACTPQAASAPESSGNATASSALSAQGGPRATRILHNAKVFTGNPAQPYAEAIAIRGEKILAVGTNAEVLARSGPQTEVTDVGGKLVIPGLNNAHTHALAPSGVHINDSSFAPGPGPTFAEIKALIAAAVADPANEGKWLVGYVGEAVLDDPAATGRALDDVAPNHGVRLFGFTGHGALYNSKGLELMGIPEEAPDPFGGVYKREPNSQRINGNLHEYADFLTWRYFANQKTDAEIAAHYAGFAARATQLGITSVQDMAAGLTQARSSRILATTDLPIRWRAICLPLEKDESCDIETKAGDKVEFFGRKWIADGTPLERFSHMNEEYADAPGWHGHANFTLDELGDLVAANLHGNGKQNQALYHVAGSATTDRLLGTMESQASGHKWSKRRPRVEHGDYTYPDNFPRMRNLGVTVVQNAIHLGLAQVFFDRHGPAVYEKIEPYKSLLDNGIPLALGTDGIGDPGNPWLDMLLATIHPIDPTEALSREQFLTAYTATSAYAEFAEDKKGTLEPGKLADLAVLSQDVLDEVNVPFFFLPGTYSKLTVVGGKVVWAVDEFADLQ